MSVLACLGTVLSLAGGVVGIRTAAEPPYTVVATLQDGVEVRRYDGRTVAETTLPADAGPEAANAAFRILARYIFGANGGMPAADAASGGSARIAMTAPVEIGPAGTPARIAMTAPVEIAPVEIRPAGGLRMRFFLPVGMTAATAPVPDDPRVSVKDVPGETVAVLSFSDFLASRTAEAAKLSLMTAIEQDAGWRAVGTPTAWYYDPPWTIPFLRRNEAAVTVARD